MKLLKALFFTVMITSPALSAEQTNQTKVGIINETEAIAIAEKVAREKHPNVKGFKSKATLTDGKWSVFILFIVAYDRDGTPLFGVGHHCFILIDRDGNVIKYIPGA